MNTPIRRLGIVASLMFCALLVAAGWIQVIKAKSYDDRPGNARVVHQGYKTQRGTILVDGKPIASSTKSDDQYVYQRSYANGTLYAPVTGYSSLIYGNGDGIEGAANDYLSGTSDKLFYRRLIDIVSGKAQQGANLQLTIDPKIQQAAAQALGNRSGAVVALNPKTGAVLAMVSSPSYDPNALASHNTKSVMQAWNQMTTASSQPMVNRTISGTLYPPGSTFKLVTAAAALESGKYSANSTLPGPATFRLPDTNTYLPNDDNQQCGNGQPTLTVALAQSCNTVYAQLGLNVGVKSLASQAEKFGFGKSLNIPMTVSPSQFPTDINRPQTALSAIGQYDVRVTPLQVAMISATIANGGKEMKPYLIKNVLDSNLNTISTTDPKVEAQPISSGTAGALNQMMQSVVNDGTGKPAAINGVQIAGKTGTAQGDVHKAASLWFTGFAPANDPKIALAVVLENGGNQGVDTLAGGVAGPVAQQVFQAALNEK